MSNGAELIALGAGGALVAWLGARATLALAGAIPLVAAVAALALYRSARAGARRGELPAAVPEQP